MIFSTLTFFIFFVVVLAALVLSKNQIYRKIVLLASSYFFYGYWDYRFLALIIFSTLVDYVIGIRLDREKDKVKRKRLLILSIVLNLGLLGFFKYFNFFIGSAGLILSQAGFSVSTLNIILPVGISFYTFQTMSYTIDIYRRKIKSTRSLLDFSVFVAFFPQLVAGPIVRASHFLPQLKREIIINWSNISIGLQIFIFGLIKKLLIADRLAIFVDRVFASPELFSSGTIWLSVVSYAIQIYCDFSGYSDMAIGLGRCMGFTLPKNFNLPYLATNLSEFWQRWHISLSSWLHEYLYIPLGGNRRGQFSTYKNIIIVMLLGGLWHGASWNFVFWGLWHGLGIVLFKYISDKIKWAQGKILTFLSWFITIGFVSIGWVFFRSQNFSDIIMILNRMFLNRGTLSISWIFTPALLILGILLISHLYLFFRNDRQGFYPTYDLKTFKGAFILFLIILAIFFLTPMGVNPFIYFQF